MEEGQWASEHPEQLPAEQDEQLAPPPSEGVKESALFIPKSENFFSTFLLPQEGHFTLSRVDRTSCSNSFSHLAQVYS